MASKPLPGRLPDSSTLAEIGHGALDVLGLIPIVGEPADIANAAWLASEGNYLDAGLSLISVVPVVGDLVGKGGKIVEKAGGKLAGKALEFVKTADFEKLLGRFRKNEKIGPYVDKIIESLEKWRKEITEGLPGCGPGGAVPCGAAAKAASNLKDFAVRGVDGVMLKAERVVEGTNDKIAVIGRTMGESQKGYSGVRDYAEALRKTGKDVELFDAGNIPAAAKAEIDLLTNGGKIRLSNNEVMKTQMFAANKAWAQKLLDEGYTIVDLGDFGNRGFSPFYAIEKQTIFGR